MNVLLFTRYEDLGPSSRLRSYQYVPLLKDAGIDIEISPLFSNLYVTSIYSKKYICITLLVITAYFKRILKIFSSNKYDLVWIEKELFPWLPSLAELLLFKLNIAYIVDYDDALFHRYDCNKNFFIRLILGNKINSVMKYSSAVVVGNKYLYEKAHKAGAKLIYIVPTAVDVKRYLPLKEKSSEVFTIGWIGSPITSKYLMLLRDVFIKLSEMIDFKLLLIGATNVYIEGINIDYRDWTLERESELLKECDVGIMPLVDDPWEKGKCGYKLIQYMACGLPVIASPVGVNCSIVENDINGFLASNEQEWVEALLCLHSDEGLRKKMGMAGRKKVEKEYSVRVTASQLADIINSAVIKEKY